MARTKGQKIPLNMDEVILVRDAYVRLEEREGRVKATADDPIVSELREACIVIRTDVALELRQDDSFRNNLPRRIHNFHSLETGNETVPDLYVKARNTFQNDRAGFQKKVDEIRSRLHEPTTDLTELEIRSNYLLRHGSKDRPKGNQNPTDRVANRKEYYRDPNVRAWVLAEAAGRCELCHSYGPFDRGDGTDFLEVHHVVFLKDGGPDTIENAVALCPNCHRECHHGLDLEGIEKKLCEEIKRRERDSDDEPEA
jgi:5-methylcytosine-specific restriction endonuclease McrA